MVGHPVLVFTCDKPMDEPVQSSPFGGVHGASPQAAEVRSQTKLDRPSTTRQHSMGTHREGIEDTRYVTLLRQKIDEARKAGKDDAAEKAQKVLDEIWRNVFPTLNDYEPEYESIYECRRKLARAILELSGTAK